MKQSQEGRVANIMSTGEDRIQESLVTLKMYVLDDFGIQGIRRPIFQCCLGKMNSGFLVHGKRSISGQKNFN